MKIDTLIDKIHSHTNTLSGVQIAKITAFATSAGASRGINVTKSLSELAVTMSFSTSPGLIFYKCITKF